MKRICRATVVLSIATFLLFTTASIAPAQQKGPFYVGVFGAFVMPDDLEVEGYRDINLDESWAFGIKGGYIIPQLKWMVAELEYTYLAKQDFDEHSLHGDFRAQNLMGNLLFRYPQGKIHPFVGFGVGLSKGEVNGSLDDDDTFFATQFIAGVNFEIAPNLSVDLAYKWFICEYEFHGNDTEVSNHMFQVGINFHF